MYQVDSTSLSLVLIVLLPKEVLIENNTSYFSDVTKTTCNYLHDFLSTSPYSLLPRDYNKRKIKVHPSTKGAKQNSISKPLENWHPDKFC